MRAADVNKLLKRAKGDHRGGRRGWTEDDWAKIPGVIERLNRDDGDSHSKEACLAVLAHAAALDAERAADLVQQVDSSFEAFLVGLEDVDAELAADMHAHIVDMVVHLGGGRLPGDNLLELARGNLMVALRLISAPLHRPGTSDIVFSACCEAFHDLTRPNSYFSEALAGEPDGAEAAMDQLIRAFSHYVGGLISASITVGFFPRFTDHLRPKVQHAVAARVRFHGSSTSPHLAAVHASMRGVLEGVENMLRYASQGTAQLRRHLATGTSFVRQALWPYLELLLSLAKEAAADGAGSVPRGLLEPLRGTLRALAIVTFRTALFRETFRAHNPTQAVLALPGATDDATLLALLVKLNVNLDAFAAPLAQAAPGVQPEARPSPAARGRRRPKGPTRTGTPSPSASSASSPSSSDEGDAATSSNSAEGGRRSGASPRRRRRRAHKPAHDDGDGSGGHGAAGADEERTSSLARAAHGTHATAHDRTGSQLASHAVRAASARQGIVTKRERARLRRERRARVAARMVEGAGNIPPRTPSRDLTSGSSDTPAGWNTGGEEGRGRPDALGGEEDDEDEEDEAAMFPEVGLLRSAIRGLPDRRRARMHALLGQPPQDGVPVHRSCASYHRLAFAFSSFHFELDALAEGRPSRLSPPEGEAKGGEGAGAAAEEEEEEAEDHPRQARPPRPRPSSGRHTGAAGDGAAAAAAGVASAEPDGAGGSSQERWAAGLQALDRMGTGRRGLTRAPSVMGPREEGKGGDDDIVLPHAKPRHFLPPLHGAPLPARQATAAPAADPIDEVLLGRDPVLAQYSRGK